MESVSLFLFRHEHLLCLCHIFSSYNHGSLGNNHDTYGFCEYLPGPRHVGNLIYPLISSLILCTALACFSDWLKEGCSPAWRIIFHSGILVRCKQNASPFSSPLLPLPELLAAFSRTELNIWTGKIPRSEGTTIHRLRYLQEGWSPWLAVDCQSFVSSWLKF